MAIGAVPLAAECTTIFSAAVEAAAPLAFRRGFLTERARPGSGQATRRRARSGNGSRVERSIGLVSLFIDSPSLRMPVRHRTNDRVAAGIDMHMLDPDRLFPAALDLGERLSLGGERAGQLHTGQAEMNAALAAIDGTRPENEMAAMLTSQMAATQALVSWPKAKRTSRSRSGSYSASARSR
jgi:hypothetical protein